MGTKRVGLARVEALIENLKRDLNLSGATLSQVAAQSQAVNLVADAANDTTITSLEGGKSYHFGTTTGAFGAPDGNNAMTFKLPTPTNIGEKIEILMTNAANIAKLIGLSCTVPALQKKTINFLGPFFFFFFFSLTINSWRQTLSFLSCAHCWDPLCDSFLRSRDKNI